MRKFATGLRRLPHSSIKRASSDDTTLASNVDKLGACKSSISARRPAFPVQKKCSSSRWSNRMRLFPGQTAEINQTIFSLLVSYAPTHSTLSMLNACSRVAHSKQAANSRVVGATSETRSDSTRTHTWANTSAAASDKPNPTNLRCDSRRPLRIELEGW